jgi:hypothetical protein
MARRQKPRFLPAGSIMRLDWPAESAAGDFRPVNKTSSDRTVVKPPTERQHGRCI